MTREAAIKHILDGVDGLEVDGGRHQAAEAIIRAGVCIIGIALLQLENPQTAALPDIEDAVRRYVDEVLECRARRSPYPRVGNGHAA